MPRFNRRELLEAAGTGLLATWASRLSAQTIAVNKLTSKISLVDGGGANVTVFAADDGLILVDSGAPKSAAQVQAALKGLGSGGKVTTVFNTHYHQDQTGNNEAFAGAKIIAHERTKQWMATDYWIQAEDRYEKARPKAALPTQTFLTTGSMKSGAEQIDYGYLIMAHTSGDIYVHFKTQNVIAVGDVASPLRDPALDYATGAWIGGRVDGMDTILKLADDQTKIIPAYGPPMTKAEFKAERDMMEEVRARLFKQVREGDGPKDMLEAGVLKGLPRTWKDPQKFLYDAAKGLWAHHDKLDPNVV
jgi:cyclase